MVLTSDITNSVCTLRSILYANIQPSIRKYIIQILHLEGQPKYFHVINHQSNLWYIYSFQDIYSSQPQARPTKYPPPSSNYRASYNDISLHRNEFWGSPSDYTTKDDAYGRCEMVIIVIVLFIWFCSIRRFYSVWKNTLGFSEAMIQGPKGWDLIFNWVEEKLRLRQQKESFLRLCELRVSVFSTFSLIKFFPQN